MDTTYFDFLPIVFATCFAIITLTICVTILVLLYYFIKRNNTKH